MPSPIVQALATRVREARRPISAFVATVLAGVVGYMLLAGIGVVEAVFWLVDPTSVELYFQTHDGPETATRAYAVLVVVGLVLSSLWIGETVLETAFGGQLSEELRRMQQQRTIDELDDHVVVCGYGMFGRTITERLEAAGRDVVVVERESEVLGRTDETTLTVQGDARREETLQRAGIERASGVVAGIDDSNANVQISIVSRQLAPDLRIVVRVGDEMYQSLARRAGADEVVIPEVVSGTEVSELF